MTKSLDDNNLPLGLPPVGLSDHGVSRGVALERSLENHCGDSLVVVCPGGVLNLVDVKAVQEVDEGGKIHEIISTLAVTLSPFHSCSFSLILLELA